MRCFFTQCSARTKKFKIVAQGTQSAGLILTQNILPEKDSLIIHFWDANGVFWKEKELAVQ